MFKKILIANRGEIAVRIIRACKEMGIQTVSVYSTADRNELHVSMSDESVCIGKASPADSYLCQDRILQAALNTHADAIHPGYGFLSENMEFAKCCEENNVVFIGPKVQTFKLLGDKAQAKQLMKAHDVPTIPGSDGSVDELHTLQEVCRKIGYPVLLKASNGGGGRGMRIVTQEKDLAYQFETAKQESLACFGSDEMYVEKLIEHPRHIEFQILADQYGTVLHLMERDCTVQRKNQKLIEETPSPYIDDSLRKKMGEAAIRVAKACEYVNAGTVEFIVDKDKNFYFMEMNTRIQVEHGVTEMAVGIDLVKEQIKIACGLKLQYKQEEIHHLYHAMEIRVNAENVMQNFMPSAGTVNLFHPPGGMNTRFDSLLFQNCVISPYYDSMVAKIMVAGNSRLECIRKLRRAIEETIIEGIRSNLAFQYMILFDKDFLKGTFDTSFVESKMDQWMKLYQEAQK